MTVQELVKDRIFSLPTVKEIVEELKKTKITLKNYEEQVAARRALQEQYARMLAAFDEVGIHAPKEDHPAVKSLTIEWTDKVFEECRRASVIIPNRWKAPKIFAMGDQQLGHRACDIERLKKDINWVKERPEVLVVLVGDSIDSATRHSKGSPAENDSRPLRQIENFIDLHTPIKDRIIGIVGGNHERRIDAALDEPGGALRLLARGLSPAGRPIPYSGGILLLDVYWRGHLWTFTLAHGAGAAQTAGAKVARLQRNLLLTDSMITISGHLHDEAKTSRRFVKRQKDGTVKVVKQTSLQIGSYLRWLGSYAETALMPPTGPDMVVIELLPDGKYIDRFKGSSED